MTRVVDQLRLLLPLAYDPNGPRLSAVIAAEAAALEAAERSAAHLYEARFPGSGEALADWERMLALPDACLMGEEQTVRQRTQSVLGRLRGRGGQSRTFFVSLAKTLGYDITITNFRPAQVGLARAGDPVIGNDWPLAWQVNAPPVTLSPAVAGLAAAGEPLAVWGNRPLECWLQRLAPAESVLIFNYGDA